MAGRHRVPKVCDAPAFLPARRAVTILPWPRMLMTSRGSSSHGARARGRLLGNVDAPGQAVGLETACHVHCIAPEIMGEPCVPMMPATTGQVWVPDDGHEAMRDLARGQLVA